jgi:monoamine oxidase
MKSGHDVTILEAAGRHGGHVFTGRDGLSDGMYADFGADHITKPGYERFFEYTKKFNLPVLPYPHAEGSDAAPGRNAMKMINGKFYTDQQLSDPAILKEFGFNDKETKFLQSRPWYELGHMYLKPYLGKTKDPDQPFGNGMDELDKIPLSDIFKKEGASETALRFLGGKNESALFQIWRYDVMAIRGIPLSHGDTFRLKGGNQELPNAFARQLGDRVKLAHTIVAIERNESSVKVKYKAFGYDEEKELSADYLVNCIPLPVFKKIPVSPALSAEKQYVVDNLSYSSHPFYVFEASSRFWLDDGFKSINMEFEHPDISSIWEEMSDPDSSRIILKAYAPGGVSA